ncbi:MAG: hypothetical protein M3320_00255 [Actinomycetota bacterium]|nr:hypothetical protein [Actinomycetota bacterium]
MTTIPLVQVAAKDAPVACSLTPSQYQERTRELSDLAARALTERTEIHGGRRLTFIDLPGVERELRAAVAAESSCCPFLAMRLERAEGRLLLDVTGPPQGQPIIAELFG